MPRRVLGTASGLAAAAALLSACDKPVPLVTVLSGATTSVVKPQTYCFDPAHCRFPRSEIAQISAIGGASLLVDVPRTIATHSWSVTAAVQKSNGTFQTLTGANYSSGAVHDTHSTRVDVPYGSGRTYFLVITQLGGSSSGSWVARVAITH